MAKYIIPVKNTEFDPYSIQRQLINSDPNNFRSTGEKVLGANNNIEVFSDVDLPSEPFSLLGNDQLARETINETLAYRQSGIGLAGKFLYNVGTTIGAEVLKVPGYIGGGVAAVADKIGEAAGLGEEGNSMEYLVDNFWVNGINSLQDAAKEAIPTYVSKDVQEGGLMTKLGSGQWWSTTGADGVGFLLSMMIPGQAIKALGAGASIAGLSAKIANKNAMLGKILSKTGAATELMDAVGAASGQFAKSANFARRANHAAAATINTFVESAAEASNTFENVVQSKIAQGYSEEQAREMAGNAAASVFIANLPLLITSNVLDEAWLWKGFNSGGQKKITNEVLRDLIVKGEINPAIKKMGMRDMIQRGGVNLLKSTGKEGLFEEGMQTRFQQAAEEDPSSPGSFFANNIGDLFNPVKYFEDLMTSTEMQESVFLGGFLGGGMSVVQTYNELADYNRQMFGEPGYKASTWMGKLLGKEKMKQEGLANVVKEGFVTSYKTLESLAEKDEKGNTITDAKGRVVINEQKLAELAEDKQKIIHAHVLYDLAVLENDTLAQSVIGTQLAYNGMQPFLAQEGGLQIYEEYANKQLAEAWAKQYELTTGAVPTEDQKRDYSKQLIEQAQKFQKIYDEVNNTNFPENAVVIDKGEEKLFGEFKERLFNQKVNALLQFEALERTEEFINKKKADLKIDLTDPEGTDKLLKTILFEKQWAPEKGEDPRANITLTGLQELVNYKNIIKESPKFKQDVTDRYLGFFDDKKVKQSWEDYKKQVAEDKANAEKEVSEEMAKTSAKAAMTVKEAIETNEQLLKAIQDAGYDVTSSKRPDGTTQAVLREPVIVKDKNGKRYKIRTESGKASYIGGTKNFLISEKGEKILLNAKTVKELDLTVISKEELAAESKAFNLLNRKNNMLQLLSEIINHKNNELNKTLNQLQEIEKQLTEAESSYELLKQDLKNTDKSNIDRRTMGKALADLNKTIKSLKARRAELEVVKEKFQRYLAIYNSYFESVQKNPNVSFTKTSKMVNDRIFDLIDKLESDLDFSNSITETQDTLNKINEQIEKTDSLIERLERIQVFMKMLVEQDNLAKELVASATLEQLSELDKLKDFLNAHPALERLFSSIRRQYNKGATFAELLKDPDYIKRIKVAFRKAYSEQNIYGTPEEFMMVLRGYLLNIDDLQERKTNAKLSSPEDMVALQTQFVATQEELEKLKKELEQLNIKKEILTYNKQAIVLQELLSERVQKRFEKLINEENIDASQKQIRLQLDPRSDANNLSIDFTESALGVNLFPTTGRNVLYDEKGNDLVHQEGPNKGLPVLNDSIHQQNWFKALDDIAQKNALDKYSIMIVNPKYDDSSELELAIGQNMPASAGRTENDLFAVLINKDTGEPAKQNGNVLFTSIWRPESLYSEKPRLAPTIILDKFLTKHKLPYLDYKTVKDADHTVFKTSDAEKIRTILGLEKDAPFTVQDVYKKALAEAKTEYTAWYDSVVKLNKEGSKVTVNIEGITAGFPLQKKDENGQVIWNNVLDNVPNIVLKKKGYGTKQLEGARFIQADKPDANGKQKVKVGKNEIVLRSGDTILLFNNESNFVPLQSRTISDDEAKLVMYLMSLGLEQGFDATVPMPEKIYYKIGTTEIKNEVRVFSYRKSSLGNFSLLHSLINYGRKKGELSNKDRKGEIYVGTNNQQIYYVDFDGNQHIVSLQDLNEAVKTKKFQDYNDQVKGLFEFLLQKRFNIDRQLLNSNPVFLYPKLKSTADGFTVEFDTSKSYYDFLLTGKNPVLKTNIVKVKDWPSFVGRNLHFNPTLNSSKPAAQPATKKSTKPTVTPKPTTAPTQGSVTFLTSEASVLVNLKKAFEKEFKTVEEVDNYFDSKIKVAEERIHTAITPESEELYKSTFEDLKMLKAYHLKKVGFTPDETGGFAFGKPEEVDIESLVITEKNYKSWSNVRDKSDYQAFVDQVRSTLAMFDQVADKSKITAETVSEMLSNVKAFSNKTIRNKVIPLIVEKYKSSETAPKKSAVDLLNQDVADIPNVSISEVDSKDISNIYDADKIISPEFVLEQKIKNNEIIQECR